MARKATTVSFSVQEEDRERFERLLQARGGGNRSELFRHAVALLEREELAQRLAGLQAAGDTASGQVGIPQDEAAAHLAALLDDPSYAASAQARDIVAQALSGHVQSSPGTRERTPILDEVAKLSW